MCIIDKVDSDLKVPSVKTINFFDLTKEQPCFAKSGDKIQFVAISRVEYNEITVQVDNGSYNIESKVTND